MSSDIEKRSLAQALLDGLLESLRMNHEACLAKIRHYPEQADHWRGAAAQAEAAVDMVERRGRYYHLRVTPREPMRLVVDNTKK